MELSELQQRVDTWIKEYGVRYFSELTNMAVLTEEVGELARVMARKYGDQSFKAGEKENLADEMADVLWVLVCLANQFRQEERPRRGASSEQPEIVGFGIRRPVSAAPFSRSATTLSGVADRSFIPCAGRFWPNRRGRRPA